MKKIQKLQKSQKSQKSKTKFKSQIPKKKLKKSKNYLNQIQKNH